MLFNLPLMAGLAAAAQTVIELLFGARWLAAVPLLKIMCIIGAIWPLNVLNLTALLAQGHSRVFLRLELVKKAIGIGILVVTISHGLVAVVWGQAMAAVIAFFVNSACSGRLLAFGSLAQLKDLLPEIIGASVMATAIILLSSKLSLSPAAKLACLAAAGIVIYAAVIAAAAPSRLNELAHHIKAAKG
jgi:O-antigen/teichoic acid export membrane protein